MVSSNSFITIFVAYLVAQGSSSLGAPGQSSANGQFSLNASAMQSSTGVTTPLSGNANAGRSTEGHQNQMMNNNPLFLPR